MGGLNPDGFWDLSTTAPVEDVADPSVERVVLEKRGDRYRFEEISRWQSTRADSKEEGEGLSPQGACVRIFKGVPSGSTIYVEAPQAANQLYCWGLNDRGQLGVGSLGGWTATPLVTRPG